MRYLKLFIPLLYCAVCITACAEKNFVVSDSYHQEIRTASKSIAQRIAPELKKQQSPWQARQILVGEFINAQTAEMTTSGHDLHAMLLIDLRQELPDMKISELTPAGVAQQDAIALQGTTHYQPNRGATDAASWFKVMITATELQQQTKLGEAQLFVNARHFDPIPSRFYRDAPMYLVGASHKQRLAAISGQTANLRTILQTEALIGEAVTEYEKANYPVSEKKFKAILGTGSQKNLIALSGLYQSLMKQRRYQEAEEAFGELVQQAITDNNISVKFLFRVRSKELRDEGDLDKQYVIWIRQIARQIQASGKCMEINGHASKSGSAEFNEKLSLQRAQWIKEQMAGVVPALSKKLTAHGKGFREAIVGSGSDNALDAIDRRVDFVLTPCR